MGTKKKTEQPSVPAVQDQGESTPRERVRVDSLKPHPRNYKTHPDDQLEHLMASIKQYGVYRNVVVARDGTILAGHGVCLALGKLGREWVDVVRLDLDPMDARALKVLAGDNEISHLGEVDDRALSELLKTIKDEDVSGLLGTGYSAETLDELLSGLAMSGYDAGSGDASAGTGGEDDKKGPDEDATPVVDRAAELQKEWSTARGQVWEIPSKTVPGKCHRMMCGDSTVAGEVSSLMGDASGISLLHADPPYGMGKESDGVANDNLYREKLDAFQMSWWRTWRPYLSDNASAYIWGNASELWRLWYVGGLADSERLTLRNEIVWDKKHNPGMSSDDMRCYSPAGNERCLFFVMGEQGFNNNADNYWDGWEPVRSLLEADCKAMGWGPSDIKRICGVGMYSHWFTRSQWTLIPEEHYKKLQAAARDHDAFKRDHDELKRDHDELKRAFYATRAYFDNTHDNMTDVWDFPRVVGEDRHGHATPKPLALVERAVKSSCPRGGIVAEPFLGSGSTLIAAERVGRVCVGMELSEAYVAVILERARKAGLEPRLVSSDPEF